MSIGTYIEDAIRNIRGYMSLTSQGAHGFYGFTDNNSALYPSAYGLPEDLYSFAVGTWPYGNSNQISIDASRVVPTALENRPASISAYFCIKY
jgi:hypothetical protein